MHEEIFYLFNHSLDRTTKLVDCGFVHGNNSVSYPMIHSLFGFDLRLLREKKVHIHNTVLNSNCIDSDYHCSM